MNPLLRIVAVVVRAARDPASARNFCSRLPEGDSFPRLAHWPILPPSGSRLVRVRRRRQTRPAIGEWRHPAPLDVPQLVRNLAG